MILLDPIANLSSKLDCPRVTEANPSMAAAPVQSGQRRPSEMEDAEG